MSNTYIQWAQENFNANETDVKHHQLVQEDCLKWLALYESKKRLQGFDLILLDPPSFSNSKRMEGIFDVQRDHVAMINRCMNLLNPGGQLIFSTNLRSFQLNEPELTKFHIENVGAKSMDPDFKSSPKARACWLLSY
jgi:23S rRNA (guanine2445-N2)-methyltransferase / 23S rRNA (guanine2069-N7)-methyltransferase